MRTIVLVLALLALTATVVALSTPLPQTAEQVVASLPGVGAGWLDTLRRVAGPTTIDTISPLEYYDTCCDLLGQFERWHLLISINVHLPEYAQFVRDVSARMCEDEDLRYVHPLAMANPAGVVGHEFGHRFEFGLWPYGGIHARDGAGWPDDTIPTWARDDNGERFADRFARAMLALRGWDVPDPDDAVLNHRVRYLLIRSYWPKDAVVDTTARSRPDSLGPRARASGPAPTPPDGTVVSPRL